MWRIASILLFLLSASLTGQMAAQHPRHVEWTAAAHNVGEGKGVLSVTATIDPGWHIFGMDASGLGKDAVAPQMTEINVDVPAGISFTDDFVASPAAEVAFDPSLKLNLPMWEGTVEFSRHFTYESGHGDLIISGSIAYMACTQRSCIAPATQAFSVVVPTGKADAQAAANEQVTKGEMEADRAQGVDSSVDEGDGEAGHDGLGHGCGYWLCLVLGFVGGLLAQIATTIGRMIFKKNKK